MQTTTRGIIWRRVILALPCTLLDNNSISGLKYRLRIMNLKTLEAMILIFLLCLRRAWSSYGNVLRKCCTVHFFKGSVTFMLHSKFSTLRDFPNIVITSFCLLPCVWPLKGNYWVQLQFNLHRLVTTVMNLPRLVHETMNLADDSS